MIRQNEIPLLACIYCGKTKGLHLETNKNEKGNITVLICICQNCVRHSFYVETDRMAVKYYGEPDRSIIEPVKIGVSAR